MIRYSLFDFTAHRWDKPGNFYMPCSWHITLSLGNFTLKVTSRSCIRHGWCDVFLQRKLNARQKADMIHQASIGSWIVYKSYRIILYYWVYTICAWMTAPIIWSVEQRGVLFKTDIGSVVPGGSKTSLLSNHLIAFSKCLCFYYIYIFIRIRRQQHEQILCG